MPPTARHPLLGTADRRDAAPCPSSTTEPRRRKQSGRGGQSWGTVAGEVAALGGSGPERLQIKLLPHAVGRQEAEEGAEGVGGAGAGVPGRWNGGGGWRPGPGGDGVLLAARHGGGRGPSRRQYRELHAVDVEVVRLV